jgi:hypothetical protein
VNTAAGPVVVNRKLILDAMAQLPVEQRAVIRRSYYDSWTVAQIADDLQIDEQTVTARLHYGVRAMLLSLVARGITRPSGRAPHLQSVPIPVQRDPEVSDREDDSLQDQR